MSEVLRECLEYHQKQQRVNGDCAITIRDAIIEMDECLHTRPEWCSDWKRTREHNLRSASHHEREMEMHGRFAGAIASILRKEGR